MIRAGNLFIRKGQYYYGPGHILKGRRILYSVQSWRGQVSLDLPRPLGIKIVHGGSAMYDDHPFSQWLQPASPDPSNSPTSPLSASSHGSSTSYSSTSSSRGHTQPQPSIYGALPYPSSNPRQPFMSFRFTALEESIAAGGLLNASVSGPGSDGPHSKTYFRVRTDAPAVGYTVVAQAGTNTPVAVVQWSGTGVTQQTGPLVELRGILSKRAVGSWLVLSTDRSYRTMSAHGRSYVWIPEDGSICLYTAGLRQPKLFARISREESDTALRLEIIAEAIQLGLLEISIVAAILLQSGRRID
ncbi:hypothetical protein MKEN_00990100 [Mycena kentingensis (nom. inval.)]|nr:hypothetical protein MKEN_00990100 [Mycena kentingensis (nom. inval.)]